MKTDDARNTGAVEGISIPAMTVAVGTMCALIKAQVMGFIYQNRLSRSPPYFAANADCERASGHSRAGLDFV